MKGNMFLGYARGSVGDVVFSRVNGQQTGRARNRRPNNPRSNGQMMQRSLFANSVKFHTRGVQRLFKFAFEDKLPNESDYNAFMRHNLSSSVRISKQASQSPLYPAFGNWQMSCGSLRSPEVTLHDEPNIWFLSLPGSDSSVSTWGLFSSILRQAYNLNEKDIITFVHITANGATAQNCPSIVPDSALQGSNWVISQYEVDSASTAALPGFMSCDDDIAVFNPSTSEAATYAQGFCVIFSRKTSSGLRVSSSYLVNNAVANTIVAACKQQIYIDNVLVDWQTEEEAILEGALLQHAQPTQGIEAMSFSLPTNTAAMTEGYIDLVFPSSMAEVAAHLKINMGAFELDESGTITFAPDVVGTFAVTQRRITFNFPEEIIEVNTITWE